MAHGARLQIPELIAASAGTDAVVGHPVHADAARVLEDLGGRATDFAARQLTPRMASDADLILTMTRAHRDAVLELAPHRLHRTFTLSEAAKLASRHGAHSVADLAELRPQLAAEELPDVADPMGRDAGYFATVGAQIAELLVPILELCRPY